MVSAAIFLPPEWALLGMGSILAVGGFAGGLVISPNQTLMLADIPVAQGGLAGSVGQLSQRIGTAIGTAVALALFYSTVYAEQGTRTTLDVYHDAYLYGMISVAIFLALSLIVGVVDLAGRRHRGEPQTP